MKGSLLSHLGEILFQELQHVVHGALAVLSGGDTYHSLAMNSHITWLHTELGRADGIPHRFGIHLQDGRGLSGGRGRGTSRMLLTGTEPKIPVFLRLFSSLAL